MEFRKGALLILQPSIKAAIALSLISVSAASAQVDIVLDQDKFVDRLGDRESSFLALDLTTGQRCLLEGSDLEKRYPPWSTFKIPNTIIGLEADAATSIDHWRDWDSVSRPAEAYWPEAWRQGQTLRSAFQRSSAWYFQDLALDVGAERYREDLQDWGYGNANVPDGHDSFWLGGPLKVSVTEKVHFLKNLLTGEFTVKEGHIADLIEISRVGHFGSFTLHGKTGSGPVRPGEFSGAFEGWYAGWLMQDEKALVTFAHHVHGDNFESIRTFRLDFAETLLAACGMNDDES
ncbi:penicillin-binding transpeptidase domain-containing protein [Yoonia sp. R2-816]|uniref:penicillin-binding transpeptidase domain-containing protein n=1 Tax=Yoonia sp. R2-816 TaxID=3342638 RepID=UPI00372C339E